jgi:hypothetical protein
MLRLASTYCQGLARATSCRWQYETAVSRPLRGGKFMPQTSRNSRRGKRNSIRVTANRINDDRRVMFEPWVPLWKAELEHLKQQLSMRLAWPALTSKQEFFNA